MIDIFDLVFIELSRYGKFPEFFRKKSRKFPTFYFSGKVTTLVTTTTARTRLQEEHGSKASKNQTSTAG